MIYFMVIDKIVLIRSRKIYGLSYKWSIYLHATNTSIPFSESEMNSIELNAFLITNERCSTCVVIFIYNCIKQCICWCFFVYTGLESILWKPISFIFFLISFNFSSNYWDLNHLKISNPTIILEAYLAPFVVCFEDLDCWVR